MKEMSTGRPVWCLHSFIAASIDSVPELVKNTCFS
jgi:hypothetical protein